MKNWRYTHIFSETFGTWTMYRGIGRVRRRFGETRRAGLRSRRSTLGSRLSFARSFSRSRSLSFSRRRRRSSISSSSRLRLRREDELCVRLLRSGERLDCGDNAREWFERDDDVVAAAERSNPPAYAFGGGTALYPDPEIPRAWDGGGCWELLEFRELFALLVFPVGTICTWLALHLNIAFGQNAASNVTRSPTFGEMPLHAFL